MFKIDCDCSSCKDSHVIVCLHYFIALPLGVLAEIKENRARLCAVRF